MLKARGVKPTQEKELKHYIYAKFNALLAHNPSQPYQKMFNIQRIYTIFYSHLTVSEYPLSPPPESLTASCSPRDLSITSSRTQKDRLISEFCVKTPRKKLSYNLPTCSATAAVFLSPTAASGICSGSPTVVRLRTA